MWNLFNCYLSGRHDYGMWCEPGAIFLRCMHCGKRSSGWALVAEAGGVAVPHAAPVREGDGRGDRAHAVQDPRAAVSQARRVASLTAAAVPS